MTWVDVETIPSASVPAPKIAKWKSFKDLARLAKLDTKHNQVDVPGGALTGPRIVSAVAS